MPSYTDKTFNQKEYIKQYQKEHYKQFKVNIKPELMEDLTEYCTLKHISRADFLKLALATLKGLEK